MKKSNTIKKGTSIEAGTKGNMITGKVTIVMKEMGLGKKDLYKCEFLSPTVIRNEGEIMETQPLTKARRTHILYKNQFEVLDF